MNLLTHAITQGLVHQLMLRTAILPRKAALTMIASK